MAQHTKTERYIVLRANMTYDIVEIDPDDLLHGFYAAICCESIEHTRLTLFNGKSIDLIVDEEGFWNFKHANPFRRVIFKNYDGFLMGDILLCSVGDRNGEPDLVPLPKETEDEVMEWLQQNRVPFYHKEV